MEIQIGNGLVFNEKDVLEGIYRLNPYEQVRMLAGIITNLRDLASLSRRELLDPEGKERSILAETALKLFKENL